MARPRKRTSWLPLAAVGVLFLAFTFLAPEVDARLRSPWAFGDGALTGAWRGTVTTPTGARVGLAFTLEREPDDAGVGRRGPPRRGYGRVIGEAVACFPDGRVTPYAISGAPEDRDARRLAFHAAPQDPAPDGLTLSWFRLGWPGGDRLAGETDMHWRRGDAAISGPDYPDTEGGGRFAGRRLEGPATAQAACAARSEMAPEPSLS